MYPVRRSERPLTGAAALLDDEGADKLLVDACTVHRVDGATLNDEMHILLNGARILPLLLRALLPEIATQPAFHVAQRNSSLRARPTSRSAECAASTSCIRRPCT